MYMYFFTEKKNGVDFLKMEGKTRKGNDIERKNAVYQIVVRGVF